MDADEYARELFARWRLGDCPCCGMFDADEEGADGTASVAVAEEVSICGECVSRGHLEPVGGIDAVACLLAALATMAGENI